MNNIFISCKECRIENNRSFYGCFHLGGFDAAQSLTVANALRRTLLSECTGLGMVSVIIHNVTHQYSTLPGMRESVLDLLLNLKEIVFTTVIPSEKQLNKTNLATQPIVNNIAYFFSNNTNLIEKINYDEQSSVAKQQNFNKSLKSNQSLAGLAAKQACVNKPKQGDALNFFLSKKSNLKKPVIGYLKVKGPGVIRAKDLKLPPFIQCVDNNQYIATLAEDGFLYLKFVLMEGKGYAVEKTQPLLHNEFVKKRSNFLNHFAANQNQSCVNNLTYLTYRSGLASVLTQPWVPNKSSCWAPVRQEQAQAELRSQGELEKYENLNHNKQQNTFMITDQANVNINHMNLVTEQINSVNEQSFEVNAKPLNLDCIFNPVTKVAYMIEDFDNKITNDFYVNLNFANHVSALVESSQYVNNLKTHYELNNAQNQQLPYGSGLTAEQAPAWARSAAQQPEAASVLTQGLAPQPNKQINHFNNLQNISNLINTYTKNEIQELLNSMYVKNQSLLAPEVVVASPQPQSQHNVVLEIWTNGSIHPREALTTAFQNLSWLFFNFNKYQL